MSNPIAGTVEYLNNTRNLHNGADHGLHDGMPSHTKGHRTSKLDTDSDGASFSSSSYEDAEDDREDSMWQSFMRRMSMTIQPLRDGDSRETASQNGSTSGRTGVGLTGGGGGGDSNMDHSNSINDKDCLPSIEEIAKESARAARMAELKTNYFEHPFGSSDSSGPSSQEDELAPWEQPPMQIEKMQSPQHTVPDFAPGRGGNENDMDDDAVPAPAASLQDQPFSGMDGQNSDEARAHTNRHQYHQYHHHFHRDKQNPPGTILTAPSPHNKQSSPSQLVHMPTVLHTTDENQRTLPIRLDDLLVSITDSKTVNKLYVFRIELHYGEIRWVIKRNIIEFYNLHLNLKIKARLHGHPAHLPSFPSQLTHMTNAALASMRITREEDEKDEIKQLMMQKRREALEHYLQELIRSYNFYAAEELLEFLELSAISIVKDMGWKGKEGYLEHKVTSVSPSFRRFFRRSTWVREWVILRDSYIAFCKDVHSYQITDVILFDKHFKIKTRESPFPPYHMTHLVLSNSMRKIDFKLPSARYTEEWRDSLSKVKKDSAWLESNRYGSFAPIRERAKCKWFVDGHDYFEAVGEAILCAKSTIFIEDWWLSPQLYLKRPPHGNSEYRLDRLLKRKAAEGVIIYVVVYKNAMVLPINSQHTKHWLQNVHPNIIVLRHANITTAPLWAHHEKILVIDHRLAFVGGLDLCFGRYDTHDHELTDYAVSDESGYEIFPGQDYSNPRIKDFTKVSHFQKETISKRAIPRMPWHDIHTAVVGPPARDIARHFIQRWNFIKSTTRFRDKPEIPYLMPKGEHVAARDEKKFRGTCRAQVVRSSAEWSLGIEKECSIYSAYVECITRAQHFIYIENQFFVTATHADEKLVKNQIGQAIVDRIKRAHREKKKFRVIVVIPSAPGFEGDFANQGSRSMALRSVAHYQYLSISRGGYSVLEKLQQANIPAEEYIGFYSLRNWGQIKSQPRQSGTTTTSPRASATSKEDSFYNTPPDSAATTLVGSTNSSSDMLQKRLEAAGLVRSGSKKRNRARTMMMNNNGSSRAGAAASIEAPLPRSRSGDYNDGRMDYVTEQVYIHSKLMIVDDKTVICGSANLNDRSQLGNRDSEIALVIEDTDLVPSQMDGKPYNAARFALSLRLHLFKEHLGLLNVSEAEQKQVQDPLDDKFYMDVWQKTAQSNTEIYRDVFHCVPDDTVHTFDEHRRFVPDPARVPSGHIAQPWARLKDEVHAQLERIRGHLVTFPLYYLCHESMTSTIVQEALPPIVFT
ncbi:hypothetical protein BCR43DRAFT_489806 [Syncephalastrum racemosum]|uniref:Phospholipase n=1 Tax=Syncephalastrum racemosum TaxID=13706 RepID=A0A1X2HEX5_SYNRA|nr:hypothetical protein BCR43DRAFT_489806 [Syncephalastrum racemosum]